MEITYWTASKWNSNIPGSIIAAETLAISAVSAQSGLTPANAMFVSVYSDVDGRVEYSSASPTASASSAFLPGGGTMWMDAVPGYEIAGITA